MSMILSLTLGLMLVVDSASLCRRVGLRCRCLGDDGLIIARCSWRCNDGGLDVNDLVSDCCGADVTIGLLSIGRCVCSLVSAATMLLLISFAQLAAVLRLVSRCACLLVCAIASLARSLFLALLSLVPLEVQWFTWRCTESVDCWLLVQSCRRHGRRRMDRWIDSSSADNTVGLLVSLLVATSGVMLGSDVTVAPCEVSRKIAMPPACDALIAWLPTYGRSPLVSLLLATLVDTPRLCLEDSCRLLSRDVTVAVVRCHRRYGSTDSFLVPTLRSVSLCRCCLRRLLSLLLLLIP